MKQRANNGRLNEAFKKCQALPMMQRNSDGKWVVVRAGGEQETYSEPNIWAALAGAWNVFCFVG